MASGPPVPAARRLGPRLPFILRTTARPLGTPPPAAPHGPHGLRRGTGERRPPRRPAVRLPLRSPDNKSPHRRVFGITERGFAHIETKEDRWMPIKRRFGLPPPPSPNLRPHPPSGGGVSNLGCRGFLPLPPPPPGGGRNYLIEYLSFRQGLDKDGEGIRNPIVCIVLGMRLVHGMVSVRTHATPPFGPIRTREGSVRAQMHFLGCACSGTPPGPLPSPPPPAAAFASAGGSSR